MKRDSRNLKGWFVLSKAISELTEKVPLVSTSIVAYMNFSVLLGSAISLLLFDVADNPRDKEQPESFKGFTMQGEQFLLL